MTPQFNESGERSSLRRNSLVQFTLVYVFGLVALYFGWRLFWFLTDDAYIAFRYTGNSLRGYGYVWNPPPFQPVEGYTSFLWVVLLDGIWRVAGIAPPDSANVVSLLFSGLTLLIGIALVWKLLTFSHYCRYRFLFSLFFVIWVLTNRTFLAWTSSGLETAMFNFLITTWLFSLVVFEPYTDRWLLGISASSTLIYLTRPDGLLFLSVTVVLILFAYFASLQHSRISIRSVAAAAPLMLVPLHLLWRWQLYGAWLPNTYYAKAVSAIDPFQSGIRFLLSFIIEYSLWFSLFPLVALLILRLFMHRISLSRLTGFDVGLKQLVLSPAARFHSLSGEGPVMRLAWFVVIGGIAGGLGLVSGQIELGLVLLATTIVGLLLLAILDLSFIQTILLLTLFLHFSYYTIVIGGDHFEFRVYSYLIAFLFLGFLWVLDALKLGVKSAFALALLFIALSWPIPWTHWYVSQRLVTRADTVFLKVSVGETIGQQVPALPSMVRRYLDFYDRVQFWLVDRAIGLRHQEHKIFHQYLIDVLPDRSAGESIGASEYPILPAASVGVVSWVLPNVNVIDGLGLNDRIIARNPDIYPTSWMAHQRMPPAGYLECFSQDIFLEWDAVVEKQRDQELTADDIRHCESTYAEFVSQTERNYGQVNDWIDQHTSGTQTIASTAVFGGRRLAQRNVLNGETRIKNWLHTIVYKLTNTWPDFVIASPYTHWNLVTNAWWFQSRYEFVEQFGTLSLFRAKDNANDRQEIQLSVDYLNGLTLAQAEVELGDLQSTSSMTVWLRFVVNQTQSTNYQMTTYWVDTQTGQRTESQSTWPYGDYLFYPSSAWLANSMSVVPIQVSVPEDLAEGSYRLGLFIYDPEADRGLTLADAPDAAYPEVQLGYFRVGDPPPSPLPEGMTLHPLDAKWQEGLTLSAVGIPDQPMRSGDVLPVHLNWQANARTDRDMTVFLHVVNEAGEIVAQSDRKPFEGRFPTAVWRTDEVLSDTMLVPLPLELPAGIYSVRIGLYDAAGRSVLESSEDDSILIEDAFSISPTP